MTLTASPYLLDCVDRGIVHYWRTLGQARDMVTHAGDIEYVISVPRGGPERVYRVRLAAEGVERRVDEIIRGIQAGMIPNALLLGPGTTPANLAEILAGKGFTLDTAAPCMALELDDYHYDSPVPESARVYLATREAHLRRWARIVNTGLFGGDLLTFEQFADIAVLPGSSVFLADDNGVPAAAAMTLRDGDNATVEMVATLPEHRCKGLGTAVVAAALQDLKEHGARTVTLRAEADGVRLYQLLGFQVVCQRVVASYPLG